MIEWWLIPCLLLFSTAAAWAVGFGLRRADGSEEAIPAGDRRFDHRQTAVFGGGLLLLSACLCLLHNLFYEYGVLDTAARAFLLAFLAVAACIDGKRHIIPLWLTRSGAGFALVYLLLVFLRHSRYWMRPTHKMRVLCFT